MVRKQHTPYFEPLNGAWESPLSRARQFVLQIYSKNGLTNTKISIIQRCVSSQSINLILRSGRYQCPFNSPLSNQYTHLGWFWIELNAETWLLPRCLKAMTRLSFDTFSPFVFRPSVPTHPIHCATNIWFRPSESIAANLPHRIHYSKSNTDIGRKVRPHTLIGNKGLLHRHQISLIIIGTTFSLCFGEVVVKLAEIRIPDAFDSSRAAAQ